MGRVKGPEGIPEEEPGSDRDAEALCHPFGEDEGRLIRKEIRQSQGFHTILRRLKWVWIGSELAVQMSWNDPTHTEQSGQKQTLPEYFPACHIPAQRPGATPDECRPPVDASKIVLERPFVENV